MGRRLHQSLRKLAVIRQQQQAFARVVEPSDWIDTSANPAQKIHDRGPAFRIVDRCDVSLGLVHQEINVSLGAVQQFSVYANVVELEISLGAKFSYDMPVDRNHPPGD